MSKFNLADEHKKKLDDVIKSNKKSKSSLQIDITTDKMNIVGLSNLIELPLTKTDNNLYLKKKNFIYVLVSKIKSFINFL